MASRIAIKLPANTKRAWVKALRSGTFKQTDGTLVRILTRSEDEWPTTTDVPTGERGYCCLGVLCRTMRMSTPSFEKFATLIANNLLTENSRTRKCLEQHIPHRDRDTQSVEDFLTHANDELKWSFRKIATWIERNL